MQRSNLLFLTAFVEVLAADVIGPIGCSGATYGYCPQGYGCGRQLVTVCKPDVSNTSTKCHTEPWHVCIQMRCGGPNYGYCEKRYRCENRGGCPGGNCVDHKCVAGEENCGIFGVRECPSGTRCTRKCDDLFCAARCYDYNDPEVTSPGRRLLFSHR